MEEDGTRIVCVDIPNPGMGYGISVQAGGELWSMTGFNELGEADLLDLKWKGAGGMWYPWEGWDHREVNVPYQCEGLGPTPYKNIRISGRNSEPVPTSLLVHRGESAFCGNR